MVKKSIAVVIISLALVVSLFSGSAFVSIASGQTLIGGNPVLDVNVPEPLLVPGESTELTVQILNDGEVTSGAPDNRGAVTTARNVRVELEPDSAPIAVDSGIQAIGDVSDSSPGTATFDITVPADANPGEYDVDVTLEYSYTSLISENSGVMQEISRTRTREATITIDDRPRFELRNGTTRTQIGDTGTVSIDVANIGGEAARDVSVTLTSGSPKVGFGTEQSDTSRAGILAPGDETTIQFDIDISDDASIRNYTLDGSVEYTNADGVQMEEAALSVGFTPVSRQTFTVSNATTELHVGENGVVSGSVTNTGIKTTRNTAIHLDSSASSIEAIEPRVAIGTLAPGESGEFELPVRVSDAAEPASRPLGLSVSYQNSDNEERTVSDVDRPTVRILPEQTFTVTNVESSLRIGEDGNLYGTLVNTGSNTARNTVLAVSSESSNIIPLEDSVAIGTLRPNETNEFRFPIEISGEAEPVPKILDLTIRYRDADNELRSYDNLDTIVSIREQRDEFQLDVQSESILPGESTRLEVEITNNLDETVTNIEPRLFTDSPLDSEDDEGFIQSLEPGESTTVTFDVSASSSALPKTYPAQLDFRYDDASGNSKVSDTYRVAIDVMEPVDGGLPWLTVIAIILVIGSGIAVYYWRYQS